ncbi:beta-ketoacyl synthase N-terminal-like domain-containing protein [Marinactinospora thermotolerans]|uniref:Act minimal PKS chain-length factor (CLF/KS beta) n=1 Tax=Marinactinospora thermotolerans DSM 45154 TaxID=1122192 RepID=A0A1T4NCT1_9ACTN|nr:beta-ketoacyl synthase N-terminal-like domain-containing protein [Marinactinospora thermotolerans]SJZ76598.1 act minimal PKS chain-length factor (CLF/KS beta) [Marinactinospora thermotolerans DSM 45154]
MRQVVITGMGITLPGAHRPDELWDLAVAGHSQVAPIDRFDTTGHTCPRAGVVADEALGALPNRLRKRMDRFSALALAAADSALADAGLSPDGPAGDIGVYLGNMYAGWEITEPSLRRLYTQGYTGVSPYIASAWFPTAAQGQVTIARGLKGFSKTVSADTAGSALAIGYGMRAIQEGRARVMLCGGAEAPITPYAYTFCTNGGRTSPTGYLPFDSRANGFCVGEGAVFLVLEDAESAHARGARVHARVSGFGVGRARQNEVFAGPGRRALSRVISTAVSEAGISPDLVDYVGLDAQGTVAADEAELAVLESTLGPAGDRRGQTTIKPVTGHLLGAAAAVEAAGALLAIRHGVTPAIASSPTESGATDHHLAPVNRAPRRRPVRNALVNARGADGTVAACLISAA